MREKGPQVEALDLLSSYEQKKQGGQLLGSLYLQRQVKPGGPAVSWKQLGNSMWMYEYKDKWATGLPVPSSVLFPLLNLSPRPFSKAPSPIIPAEKNERTKPLSVASDVLMTTCAKKHIDHCGLVHTHIQLKQSFISHRVCLVINCVWLHLKLI